MTNYRRTFDPTKLSASTPPEQRLSLPAPEVVSEVYRYDNLFAVDLRCHNGRFWSLVDTRLKELEYKLKYFKALDREVIRDLFMTFPKSPMPIIQWMKAKGLRCVTCKLPARLKPNQDREIFGCAACGEGIQAEAVPVPKKTPDAGIPVTDAKPKEVPAKPQMNAMQRLRAKKGIQ